MEGLWQGLPPFLMPVVLLMCDTDVLVWLDCGGKHLNQEGRGLESHRGSGDSIMFCDPLQQVCSCIKQLWG